MNFAAAIFLLGFGAVAGPLLAHLLARPRFKRVPFTMLRFLHEGHIETQSRRRLRDLFVLAIRCCIIGLIVLAYAGPLLVSNEPETQPLYVLGLDDSLSMAYASGGESRIEWLRERASDYLHAQPAGGAFMLVGLASGLRLGPMDRGSALAMLSTFEPTTAKAAFEELIAACTHAGPAAIHVYLASDFTPAAVEALEAAPAAPPAVDALTYDAIESAPGYDNVTLSEAVVLPARNQEGFTLSATLLNQSAESVSREIRFVVGKHALLTAQVELAPHETKTVFRFLDGAGMPHLWRENNREADTTSFPLAAELQGRDGLAADDAWYMGIAQRRDDGARVLLIAANSTKGVLPREALHALSAIPEFGIGHIVQANDLAAGALGDVDAVLAAQWTPGMTRRPELLQSYVKGGGHLVVFLEPPGAFALGEAPYAAARGLLPATPRDYQAAETRIAPRAALPANALSPDGAMTALLSGYRLDGIAVKGRYALDVAPEAVCLWRFQEGAAGLVYYRALGGGSVVLVNTSADGAMSTLMKSPAALPFCRFLLGPREPHRVFAFEAGETLRLPATKDEEDLAAQGGALWLESPAGKPLQAGMGGGALVAQAPKETGWVRTAAKPVRWAGVNVPEKETLLAPMARENLERALERVFEVKEETTRPPAAQPGGGTRRAQPLWHYAAWLALALIVLDTWATNRMKR